MADAQRLATRRALDGLGLVPDIVLIDGNWDFAGTANTLRIVRGDARCLTIAAASMLAKVTRDRQMRALAPNYPHYEFQANKGYPCWRHKMALQAYGPCAIHRRTWVFMDSLSWDMRSRRPGWPAPGPEVSAEPGELAEVAPDGGYYGEDGYGSGYGHSVESPQA
jgi:ribonuclease HII